MQEKDMTNEESLRLITEMIQKAKGTINENGTSAMLWGCVVAVCGFVNFAELYWHFKIGFDIWLLTLAAIVPQVIISIKEGKREKVKTHTQSAIDAVWGVYTISIFALVFYLNIVPVTTMKLNAVDGMVLMQKNLSTGVLKEFYPMIPSVFSLFLIIYAFPTMITGIVSKFKPMVFGALLCYVFFIISLFTSYTWDALLIGLSGIFNWFIPGILLRRRYLRQAS